MKPKTKLLWYYSITYTIILAAFVAFIFRLKRDAAAYNESFTTLLLIVIALGLGYASVNIYLNWKNKKK